ncbi:MAG: hypothetical protein K2J71_01680 [Oscillospiraceae bacterium]|nr:hypothetical protein [Oscillospiraceae bacterium]
MRKVRFILITVVVMILGMVVFSGCGESREQKMKVLVEEKYGEEFTILKTWTQPYGADVTRSEYHATAAPVDDPESIFELTVWDFKEKHFRDTYPQAKIAALLSEQFKEQIDSYFEDCYVWGYSVDTTEEEKFQQLDEITVEQYTKMFENPRIQFRLLVNASVYQNTAYADEYDYLLNTFSEFIQVTGIEGSLLIYFLPAWNLEEYILQRKNHYTIDDSLEQPVKGFNLYVFTYSSENQWSFWVYKGSYYMPAATMTKEDYIVMRKEHD